jgi:hypothetical protein
MGEILAAKRVNPLVSSKMAKSFKGKESSKVKSVPTKRTPDVWDSAAFSSIFLASSFFCSQALSTPAHTQVTQTVGHRVLECFHTFQENFLNISATE